MGLTLHERGWVKLAGVNGIRFRRVSEFVLRDEVSDDLVLEMLACNMTLAPTNDTGDTLHWLREHAASVGIAEAVAWFATCAARRVDTPFHKCPDWKGRIARDRIRS